MLPDTVNELNRIVDIKLEKGYSLFEKYLKVEVPDSLKHFASEVVSGLYNGRHLQNLACACQCFYWFRYLHSAEFLKLGESSEVEEFTGNATLLGDYFFSQFSKYLIPIDSTELIDRFADFLKNGSTENIKEFFEHVYEVLDD